MWLFTALWEADVAEQDGGWTCGPCGRDLTLYPSILSTRDSRANMQVGCWGPGRWEQTTPRGSRGQQDGVPRLPPWGQGSVSERWCGQPCGGPGAAGVGADLLPEPVQCQLPTFQRATVHLLDQSATGPLPPGGSLSRPPVTAEASEHWGDSSSPEGKELQVSPA